MFNSFFHRWNTQIWYKVNTGGRTRVQSWERFEKANAISSQTINGKHKILLDIDMPVKIYESTSQDHYHLYIDKEIDWETYKTLLKALAVAGIISEGYCNASIEQNGTYLRLPWIMKHEGDGFARDSEGTPIDDNLIFEKDETPSDFENRTPWDEI